MSIEICIRGPATSPRSTASFTPASAPAASRTLVIPACSVAARFCAAMKNRYENGVWRSLRMLISLNSTCTWQSNRPGTRVFPLRSTDRSPSPVPAAPTWTMRSPSTTTSPGRGSLPVPSKIWPPVNSVRVTPWSAAATEDRAQAGPLVAVGLQRVGANGVVETLGVVTDQQAPLVVALPVEDHGDRLGRRGRRVVAEHVRHVAHERAQVVVADRVDRHSPLGDVGADDGELIRRHLFGGRRTQDLAAVV